jgi:hypothetical protein
MKNKQLRLRMSERRYDKLKLYAIEKDKTMTQVIDELIDSLPSPERDNSSETNIAN